jgi:AraC-like DNA-binding protein
MDSRGVRAWAPTDRPGEWIAVSQPFDGVEVLSVRGSTRGWTEVCHPAFAVAAVRRTPSVPAPSELDVVKLGFSWLEHAADGMGVRHGFRVSEGCCENDAVSAAIRDFVEALGCGAATADLEAACHHVAAAVLGELGARRAAGSPGPDPLLDFRVRRAREYLIEHVGPRPTLEELEAGSGLAKSQLSALFKRAYGMPMGAFWLASRVARAKTALLDGALASDVAFDLGFSDEPHLIKVFRRYEGLPPRAWVSLVRRNARLPAGAEVRR